MLVAVAIGPCGAKAEGELADAEWLKIQPICEATTKGRYPFDKGSAEDADMAAFASLFAPAGSLDTFFAAHVAQFVDQSTSPWTIRQGVGAESQLSAAALDMFQRAAKIRSVFFPDGAEIEVRMEITPEALDPQAMRVDLGIDGNLVTYSQDSGPPTPGGIVWPGEIGESFVIFSRPGKTVEWRAKGAWALLRLIDASRIQITDLPNRKRLFVEVEGLVAIFVVRSTALLPFGLGALDGFNCPQRLH